VIGEILIYFSYLLNDAVNFENIVTE
jgi:hypothetical protein